MLFAVLHVYLAGQGHGLWAFQEVGGVKRVILSQGNTGLFWQSTPPFIQVCLEDISVKHLRDACVIAQPTLLLRVNTNIGV